MWEWRWEGEGEGRGEDRLSLIGVPVIGRRVDVLALVAREQLVEIVHAHAPADDLADARHEDVDALGHARVSRVALHVEGFDLGGEVGEEDGAVDDVGHFALGGLGDVVAEGVRFAVLVVDAVLVQPVDGGGVAHAEEGPLGDAEAGVQLVHELFGGGVGEGGGDDGAHDEFDVG